MPPLVDSQEVLCQASEAMVSQGRGCFLRKVLPAVALRGLARYGAACTGTTCWFGDAPAAGVALLFTNKTFPKDCTVYDQIVSSNYAGVDPFVPQCTVWCFHKDLSPIPCFQVLRSCERRQH